MRIVSRLGNSPHERIPRPELEEDVILVVEEGEVGINLYHPVRLHEDDCNDEGQGASFGQERLEFDPGDNVMEREGGVKEDRADRQPPGVVKRHAEEDKEAMPDAQYQLHQPCQRG